MVYDISSSHIVSYHHTNTPSQYSLGSLQVLQLVIHTATMAGRPQPAPNLTAPTPSANPNHGSKARVAPYNTIPLHCNTLTTHRNDGGQAAARAQLADAAAQERRAQAVRHPPRQN